MRKHQNLQLSWIQKSYWQCFLTELQYSRSFCSHLSHCCQRFQSHRFLHCKLCISCVYSSEAQWVWRSSTFLCFVLSLSLRFFTSFWAADKWEQLTKWCSSSQRKHFRNYCDWRWCDWLLSKSERLLRWWLILRLFCL